MENLRKEVVPTSNDNEKLKMETTPKEEESQKETSTKDDGKFHTTQELSKETAGKIETQKVGRQWCMEHFSLFFNKLFSWWKNQFATLTPEYPVAIE
jgi:hypothetical protein